MGRAEVRGGRFLRQRRLVAALCIVALILLIPSSLPAQEKRPGTGATTSVASSITSVQFLAVNVERLGATIFNDSTQILYVKFGATASTTSFTVRMASNDYFEFPFPIYTGVVNGIWASANGSARITELTR